MTLNENKLARFLLQTDARRGGGEGAAGLEAGGGQGTPAQAGPSHPDARAPPQDGTRGGQVSPGRSGASFNWSHGSWDSSNRNADRRPSPLPFPARNRCPGRAGQRNGAGHGGHNLWGSASFLRALSPAPAGAELPSQASAPARGGRPLRSPAPCTHSSAQRRLRPDRTAVQG